MTRAVWFAAAGLASAAAAAWGADGDMLRVAKPVVRAIDGITVDVSTAALRNSSNVRLAVVEAGSEDAVADVNAFAARSVPIHTGGRVRLTLPPGPPGEDEVRLYHVPAQSTSYVVADRARVLVQAGEPGAVLPTQLGAEARELGPVRFEAKYRDSPVLVQAQFLRVYPETAWDVRWFGGAAIAAGGRPVAVLDLGVRGVVPDGSGSTGEAVCLVDAGSRDGLQKVASLSPGDAVLVRGEPTVWQAAGPSDPVVLRGCQFAR